MGVERMSHGKSAGTPFPLVVPIAAVLGLLVYVATAMISPLNGEDFALTRDMAGLAPLDRLEWIAGRSFTQMSQWNARLGEQLAIFWLGMPRIYFALASALSLLLFCALAARWACDASERVSFAHAAVYSLALIWLFWPGYEVFFWTTAQAAYFQPMLFALLLVSIYLNPSAIRCLSESNLRCFVASVLACLVGVSFENVPPAIGASIALVLLLRGRSTWRVRTLLPLVLLAVAWGALMLAPSTAIRRATYAQMYPAIADVGYYVARVQNVLATLLATSWLLVATAIVASVYLWKVHGWRQQLIIAWTASCLTVATVVAAPYTEPRAFIVSWGLWYILIVAATVRLVSIPRFRSGVTLVVMASLWFPLQANLVYVEFARSLQERDSYLRVMARTGRCGSGINVGHNPKRYPYKYLNSREAWVVGNPRHVSSYYGCQVLVQ